MKNNCYNCTYCIYYKDKKACRIQNYFNIYQPTLECSKFKPILFCRLFKIDNTPKPKVIDLTDNCKRLKI